MELEGGYRLRSARPADLPALYRVCLATGDSGRDASHLQDDPDLLGQVYVGPYVVLEPDLAFALDGPSGVAGYLLGALDTPAFNARLEQEWLRPLRSKVRDPGADEARWSGGDWVRRLVHHPVLAFPPALAPYPSHGHIDLVPEAQGRGLGRPLLRYLMQRLAAAGSPGMHLQVSPANARALTFYAVLGFARLHSPDLPEHTAFLARRLERSGTCAGTR